VTGNGWLDWPAVAVFAAVTVLSLVRLVVPARLGRAVDHFHDDAFHAVMGVAMVAMFWPGGGTLPGRAWVAVIGLVAVWPVLVFARARTSRSRPATSEPRARTGRAGYYLASALVMIVTFGAGHGSLVSDHPGSMAMGSLSSPSGHAVAQHAVAQHAFAQDVLTTVAGWPIWPLAGASFLLYAAWLAIGGRRRRRPTPELACTMAMAAGMAFMAFSI
jgi:hypothetical protein